MNCKERAVSLDCKAVVPGGLCPLGLSEVCMVFTVFLAPLTYITERVLSGEAPGGGRSISLCSI